MTEYRPENSVIIDFSDEAYKERMELSLDRLSEFDEKKASALFLCCKEIYKKTIDSCSNIFDEDAIETCAAKINAEQINAAKIDAAKIDAEQINVRETDIEKTDTEKDIKNSINDTEKLFLHEFSFLPKLKKLGRVKDITVLFETLIQLEIAIEENCTEEEEKDILYSYIYDYIEEYTELFAKTGHGIAHISDEITPFGMKKELCKLIGPLFGDRLKAKKLSAIKETVKIYGKDAFSKEAYCKEVTGQKNAGQENAVQEDAGQKNAGLKNIGQEDAGRENAGCENTGQENGEIFVENSKNLTEHQNNILKKFMNETRLLLMAVLVAFVFTACSKKDEAQETEEVIAIESSETEETEAEDQGSPVEAETLYVSEEIDTVSKYYGIMYAKVLDIDTESGSGSRYTLEDKNDPENAWSVTASDVAFINVDLKIGADIVVLYHGDIISDFENVDIIAMLPNGKYRLSKLEGTTTSNMMEQFSVSTGGKETVFLKDNCRIDSEAMDSDKGDSIIVYYADGGKNGKWPLRVLKGNSRRTE